MHVSSSLPKSSTLPVHLRGCFLTHALSNSDSVFVYTDGFKSEDGVGCTASFPLLPHLSPFPILCGPAPAFLLSLLPFQWWCCFFSPMCTYIVPSLLLIALAPASGHSHGPSPSFLYFLTGFIGLAPHNYSPPSLGFHKFFVLPTLGDAPLTECNIFQVDDGLLSLSGPRNSGIPLA